MVASVTPRSLYEALQERLSLKWLAGRPGEGRIVQPRSDAGGTGARGRSPLVGSMNLIRPRPIQVLGAAELHYLNGLRKNSRRDAVARLFGGPTVAVVICGADPVADDILKAAADAAVTVLSTPLPGEEVIVHLDDHLDSVLGTHVTLHGVLMEVAGIGVLLTGASGIGKSELALELISRGHRLIADDAPELHRVAPDTLKGTCPPVLRDFLEVRGLGVLNIRAMFGDSAIKHDKNLRLIIHLEAVDERQLRRIDRLHGSRQNRDIQGVELPQVTLPVVPGLNLAVLVECAVRNHILRTEGYNSGLDFVERQQRYLAHHTS